MAIKVNKIDDDILADWILSQLGGASHLKLQKLLFYCYGGLVAKGFESVLRGIRFEAWKYGPVCRTVWDRFKNFEGRIIKPIGDQPNIDAEVAQVLSDILKIYGRLSPGQLVNETHFEDPWIKAFKAGAGEIPKHELDEYFRLKFGGQVYPPRVTSGIGSFEIDGIPVRPFPSLRNLAKQYSR